jgi:hypothetical protein
VVGLFNEWGCSSPTVQLNSGDIFVVYTDGVSEAADAGGEEFGEERLIRALHRNRTIPASGLLDALIHDVQQFSSGDQGDDLTLVVGKAFWANAPCGTQRKWFRGRVNIRWAVTRKPISYLKCWDEAQRSSISNLWISLLNKQREPCRGPLTFHRLREEQGLCGRPALRTYGR